MERRVLTISAMNTELLESTSFFVAIPKSAFNAINVNIIRQMNLTRQDLVCNSNCTSTSHCNNTLL